MYYNKISSNCFQGSNIICENSEICCPKNIVYIQIPGWIKAVHYCTWIITDGYFNLQVITQMLMACLKKNHENYYSVLLLLVKKMETEIYKISCVLSDLNH